MTREDLTFTGAHGGTLSGVLEIPEGRARSWAVFAHCFTCGKDSHAASRISRALASRGIGVLRFDFTGLGESGGDFADSTFTSDVADLVRAADLLREQDRAPGLLVGHSLGGAAVIAAAGRIPEVAAVATVNAPAHPAHVSHVLEPAAEELASDGVACIRIAGRDFTVRRELLEDLSGQAQAERLASLRAALLVLHAPGDDTVGIDNARELFELARHPKSFVALDGADHLLSRRADSLYAADVIAAWASRYLAVDHVEDDPETQDRRQGERRRGSDRRRRDAAAVPDRREGLVPAEEPAPTDQPAAPGPSGSVVVRETGDGPFVEHVTAGRHSWVADEPTDVPGGTDTGPSPYDHLLAGLGTCTAMTLRMYATRKKIPLERVSVRMHQEQVHAVDLTACVDGGEGCMRQFTREITLEGDLDDQQRDALLRIADRCPVHRTLEGGVRVVTTLAGGTT